MSGFNLETHQAFKKLSDRLERKRGHRKLNPVPSKWFDEQAVQKRIAGDVLLSIPGKLHIEILHFFHSSIILRKSRKR